MIWSYIRTYIRTYIPKLLSTNVATLRTFLHLISAQTPSGAPQFTRPQQPPATDLIRSQHEPPTVQSRYNCFQDLNDSPREKKYDICWTPSMTGSTHHASRRLSPHMQPHRRSLIHFLKRRTVGDPFSDNSWVAAHNYWASQGSVGELTCRTITGNFPILSSFRVLFSCAKSQAEL